MTKKKIKNNQNKINKLIKSSDNKKIVKIASSLLINKLTNNYKIKI
jgi:hypothetical protein